MLSLTHYRFCGQNSARDGSPVEVAAGSEGVEDSPGIGEELCLSVKTVSTYRGRVLTKLGLHSNADLVRYCLEHGLAE